MRDRAVCSLLLVLSTLTYTLLAPTMAAVQTGLPLLPKPAYEWPGSGESLFVCDIGGIVLSDDATLQSSSDLLDAALAACGCHTNSQLPHESESGSETRPSIVLQILEPASKALDSLDDVGTIRNEPARALAHAFPNTHEAYVLDISSSGVVVSGVDAAGVFYGVQSLLQLLPTYTSTLAPSVGEGLAPVVVVDGPRFGWRGMHLDVGRHFFSVHFVKRFLDVMAEHKLNTFHWHLTEDQGWRIEIKSHPKLTSVSAWREETPYPSNRRVGDSMRYGGFYTQDEIREVVAYAATLHITVVPEIEFPGHSQAVLAAYPELSCTGGPHDVGTTWGVFDDVLCAGNEAVFDWAADVLAEIVDLFPSKYIHVGGDECPKTRWKACPKCNKRMRDEGLSRFSELQSYFMTRIGSILADHGRRMVGWDEIMHGGTPAGATVMVWHNGDFPLQAARAGHDVVRCPTAHCYFDYYSSENKRSEPPAIGGYLPLETVYEHDPAPSTELTPEEAKHILGSQGNVWTEYMPTEQQVEYMTHPRLSALAEVVWSPQERREYSDFLQRLPRVMEHLTSVGVNHRPLDKK